MNAMDIIEQVRAHNADVVADGGHLVVREHGEPLPEELRRAVREHKPELLVALGEPMDRAVASVLGDLRRHLAPPLRKLTDSQLLVLVNWHIIAAWQKLLREAEGGRS